jgi:hypothetical protein
LILARVQYGRELFPGGDLEALRGQILAGHRRACPVLAAALHPDPARRYPAIEQFRSKLTGVRKPDGTGPREAGELTAIWDLLGGKNLLEEQVPGPWAIPNGDRQRPLRLVNGGRGRLHLRVTVQGQGISVSPERQVIPPGQNGAVIVQLDPGGDRRARLRFEWDGQKPDEVIDLWVHRPGVPGA